MGIDENIPAHHNPANDPDDALKASGAASCLLVAGGRTLRSIADELLRGPGWTDQL